MLHFDRSRVGTLLRLAVVISLVISTVAGAVAAPVAAQADGPGPGPENPGADNSSSSDAGPTDGSPDVGTGIGTGPDIGGDNGTENGSENSTDAYNPNARAPSGGGGLFGTGDLFSVDSWIESLTGILMSLGEGTVDFVHSIVTGVPAPGDHDDLSTWNNPTDSMWQGVLNAWAFPAILGSTMFLFAASKVFAERDSVQQRERAKNLMFGLIGASLAWVLLPGLLHLVDVAIDGIVPGGSEFMQTPEDIGRFAVGAGVGLAVAVLKTAVFAGGLFVIVVMDAIVFFVYFMWIPILAARCYGGFLKSIGDSLLYMFGMVLVVRVVQALILRLLFTLDLGGVEMDSLYALVILLGGLFFALLYMPKIMMDHANSAAAFGLGMSSARGSVTKHVDRAHQRVSDKAIDSYKNYRQSSTPGESTGGSGSSSGSTFGKTGSTFAVGAARGSGSGGGDGSDDPPRSGGGTTTGGGGPPPSGGGGTYDRAPPSGKSPGVDGIDGQEWQEQHERMKWNDSGKGFN